MRRPVLARALRGWLVLVMGVGVLGGVLLLAPRASAGSLTASAAADAAPALTVLVGAPGLAWSDIDPTTTPTLTALADGGSVASMTVRAVRPRSCAVDGWLTLSAGRRAADAEDAGCTDPPPVTGDTVPGWGRYVAATRAQSYGAVPGTLGQGVLDAGGCVETVGPGAAIAGADLLGRVTHHDEAFPASPVCSIVIVDGGSLPADRPTRTEALRRLDETVRSVVRGAAPGTRVVVAGVGDGVSEPAPRAVIVSGPPSGVLTSPSTRQAGLVQLQDLTATLLDQAGASDAATTGRPVSVAADEEPGADRVGDRVALERRATTMRALAPQVTGWLAALFTLWAVAVTAARWRERTVRGPLAVAGVAIATVPVATFLANLLPWWRADPSGVAFVLALLAAVAVTTAPALVVGRRQPLGGLRVVALVTLFVLAGDVLTGSTLQLSSVFGQNPVVGGRFYGLGNTSFALYGLATLVVVQWVGSSRRLGRPWGVVLATLVLLAALAVEGHPSFGADFGGPPALLLGGLVVLAGVAGVRLTVARVVAAVLAAGLLTVAVAVADWLRPAESRTHLGEFVQTVLDGGAGEVVGRKLAQNLSNLGSPALLATALATALLAGVLWRTGWAPSPPGTIVLRGALVLAAVGFAVNDSGLVIPAYVAVVLAPLLLADRAAEGGVEAPWRPDGVRRPPSRSSAASPSSPTPGT